MNPFDVQSYRSCFALLNGNTSTLIMEIDKVSTPGAALASLLQSMSRNDLDFDGLILGKNQLFPLVLDNSARHFIESFRGMLKVIC